MIFAKKKETFPWIQAIAALLAVVIGIQIYSIWKQQPDEQLLLGIIAANLSSNLSVLLDLNGYEKVNLSIPSPGVILVETECLRIPMTTDFYQSESIQNGLEGVTSIRPNSHDIFAGTVKNFGIEVVMVKVYEMKDQMYFAKVIMKKDGNYLSIDARPSDATAIAVRLGTPVYFKKGLLVGGERTC